MITEDSTAALLYARGDTATRQQPGECSFYHSKFCIEWIMPQIFLICGVGRAFVLWSPPQI